MNLVPLECSKIISGTDTEQRKNRNEPSTSECTNIVPGTVTEQRHKTTNKTDPNLV